MTLFNSVANTGNSERDTRVRKAAIALCERLSAMTWADRRIGFAEWAELVRQLNLGDKDPEPYSGPLDSIRDAS